MGLLPPNIIQSVFLRQSCAAWTIRTNPVTRTDCYIIQVEPFLFIWGSSCMLCKEIPHNFAFYSIRYWYLHAWDDWFWLAAIQNLTYGRKYFLSLWTGRIFIWYAQGTRQRKPLSPILGLEVNPPRSRVIYKRRLPWEIQYPHCSKSQSKQSYLSVNGNLKLFTEKPAPKNKGLTIGINGDSCAPWWAPGMLHVTGSFIACVFSDWPDLLLWFSPTTLS